MNSRVLFALAVVLAASPTIAAAQAPRFSIQAAAGTDIRDGGDNQSLSFGFSPDERWDVLIGAQRIHLPTKVSQFGATRGGTVTFFGGEVRFLPFTLSRFSPYLLASLGRGKSRLNVDETFPNPVTNDAFLLFFGGGVHVPVTPRFVLFSDLRFGIWGERDVIVLNTPVRGGVAWRF